MQTKICFQETLVEDYTFCILSILDFSFEHFWWMVMSFLPPLFLCFGAL